MPDSPAAPRLPLSADADGPLPLDLGCHGEPVRDLQRRLNALEIDVGSSDGIFDQLTQRAVSLFQAQRGLHQTGSVDVTTWSQLVEAGYRLGDRYLYLRAPMFRGDDVADLQLRLNALGFDAGRVDGIFGPDTEHALRDFEQNTALTIDGVCGRDVIAALERLGSRHDHTTTVAHVRERERLRRSPRELDARRVVLGGGLSALLDATARALHDAGATAAVLPDPDPSAQAASANAFNAEAFLAIDLRADGPGQIAYYARPGFESAGGHRLADLIVTALTDQTDLTVDAPNPMRLPVLRETRMPAVVCELGPSAAVVQQTADVANALTAALRRWCGDPIQP